jgi:hypothetical protein
MSVQSRPTTAHARAVYTKSGVIAVACVALILFILVWLLNGYFTARAATGIGGARGWQWLGWGAGWCIHLIISVCEQHAWKVPSYVRAIPLLADVYPYVLIVMWALAVLVGSADTLTTAVGLVDLLNVTSWGGVVWCVILAEVAAVLPEPLIVGLVLFLVQMRRR